MKHTLLFFLMIVLSASLYAQATYFVKPTATGTGDGTSWANASADLQLMINNSAANDQIWVAAGTYLPNRRADALTVFTPNDRKNAFVLKTDVKIYGGFAGTETLLTQRNLSLTANASILSGDLGTATVNTDNAYHVVISAGDAGTAELNGFTIKDGYANGDLILDRVTVNTITVFPNSGGGMYNDFSSPIINNVTIGDNYAQSDGGGMYNNNSSSPVITHVNFIGNEGYRGAGINNSSSSSPVITNVTLSGNTTDYAGGGIFNISSSNPKLTNVTISGNTAVNHGGGIYNANSSSPVLTNVTISGNTAAMFGGGIFNTGSSNTQIRNSIIYGNNTGNYNTDGSIPVITYSLVQGLTDTDNGNIADTDPKFADATNGDYHLQDTSPLINKGSNVYYSEISTIVTDIEGNTRIYGSVIDLGAYENQTVTLPVLLLSFTAKAEGNRALLQWKTASEQNNKNFIIYRSDDEGAFVAIGKKPGAGTATTAHSYSFYDASPLSGANYYKLVQVDNDGKETDLGVRQVSFELSAFSLQLYPNPTVNTVYAQFEAGVYHTAALLNMTGLVHNKKAINKDDTLLDFDLSALPAGVYIIKLSGEKESSNKRVVKR